MFGRKRRSRIETATPIEATAPQAVSRPNKPDIPPFRTWEVGLPDGQKLTVQAHYSKMDDGERHFMVVHGYYWSVIYMDMGTWMDSAHSVFIVRNYTYVKEI